MADYCDRDDVDAVFGSDNVDQWADLDNDQDAGKITARIAAAITAVSADMDDVFRVMSYRIPVVTAASATPTTVTYQAARLAGLWLYEARGCQSFDPETGQGQHQLAFIDIKARRWFDDLRAGRIRLDAE